MALLLSLVLNALAARHPAAPSVPALPPPPPPDPLVVALSEDSPPADYVFLLETSQRLLPTANAARPGIAAFIRAVPVGDRVTILAYHTRVSEALPTTVVTAAGREDLVKKVLGLSFASAVDEDLGAAFAEVIERYRESAGAYEFLFIIGSFCHSPTLTSPYDSGGRGCRAIKGQSNLDVPKARAQDLTTWLLPVATPQLPIYEGGVTAAKEVFAGATRVDVPSPGAWLETFVRTLPATRAVPLARRAVSALSFTASATVDPGPTPGAAEGPLTATIALQGSPGVLGLALEGITVNGQPAMPAGTTLPGTVTAPISVPPPPFALFPRADTVDIPLEVVADGRAVPEEALGVLGVDASRPGLSARASVQVARHYGLPLQVTLGGAALLALFGAAAAVVARNRMVPLRLGGTFAWRKNGEARQAFDISHLSVAPIEIDETSGRLVVGRPEKAVLILRAVRQGWKVGGEVEICRDGVEINTRKVSKGRHPIIPGATSFQMGEYRLTWE